MADLPYRTVNYYDIEPYYIHGDTNETLNRRCKLRDWLNDWRRERRGK